MICKTWILLDSCSTDTVFKNPDLVNNIRRFSVDDEIRIMTDGGSVYYNKVAECKCLPLRVYFNKHHLADVLPSTQVDTMPVVKSMIGTSKENTFTVHLKNDHMMKFQECSDILYY